MKLQTNLAIVLAAGLLFSEAQTSFAQSEDDDLTFDVDDVSEDTPAPDDALPEPEEDVTPESELPEPEVDDPDDGVKATAPLKGDLALTDDRASWKDIVVVVRKPFLKLSRLEIMPQWGISMNDNLIRHQQLNLALNYYITDILGIGLEGHLYAEEQREPLRVIGAQTRLLTQVNKYNWGAQLNFHYVPIHGKFAVLDEYIVHWETALTAGIGVTQSEVIPQNPSLPSFTNLLITPNAGASMRFFITKYLTFSMGVRDYVFIDRFEPSGRSPTNFASAQDAKDNADSSFINNVMFQAGIGFWFPPSFEYTTFR